MAVVGNLKIDVLVQERKLRAKRCVVDCGNVRVKLAGPGKSSITIDGKPVNNVRSVQVRSDPTTGFLGFVTLEIIGKVK